jgi:dienelactone hydrolase
LDYLATLPDVDASRVAVMGFSMGAYVINLDLIPRQYASPAGHQFRAAIALYGACIEPHSGLGLNTTQNVPFPVLEVIPEHDNLARDTCVPLARSWLSQAVIPAAYHAFDQNGMSTPGKDAYGTLLRQYSGAATEQAHRIVGDFLARTLNQRK